jgi:hypothetical protein
MDKNQDPRSGINIPDPQHCPRRFWLFLTSPALNIQLPGDTGPLAKWTGSEPTHYLSAVGGGLGETGGRCLLSLRFGEPKVDRERINGELHFFQEVLKLRRNHLEEN